MSVGMAVRIVISVAVGAGGWVSVGGTGVFVARIGVLVGRIGVLVGRIGVFVEGGRLVGASGVDVPMSVGSGSRTRGVALTSKVAVGVEVRVRVGVAVAIVEVAVGISDGVDVGAVDVGKGPSRAAAVCAMADFVPAAVLDVSRSWRHGFPNRITKVNNGKPINKRICRSLSNWARFSGGEFSLILERPFCWQDQVHLCALHIL